MHMTAVTPATAPAAGLLDLALLDAERLERIQLAAGRRGGQGLTVQHEIPRGGTRQSE